MPQETASEHFGFGDRLIHPAKPEWGVGTVSKATPDSHQGVSCQRLAIRFERAGLKTISTGIVTFRRADDQGMSGPTGDAPAAEIAKQPADWLDQAGGSNPSEAMGRLPESALDPFTTPVKRLEETLKLFRFTREPAALLDWASTQTGLADPLTRFSRTELEQFFVRYEHNREKHLHTTVQEARRSDQAATDRLLSTAPRAAQNILRGYR